MWEQIAGAGVMGIAGGMGSYWNRNGNRLPD